MGPKSPKNKGKTKPASTSKNKGTATAATTTATASASASASSSDETTTTSSASQPPPPPSLPKLLASLALGARSVNNLPFSLQTTNNSDDEDKNDEQDEDEYSFRMSLPEFASLNNEARRNLSELLCQALDATTTANNTANDDDDDDDDNNNTPMETNNYEFDDPDLWEKCADACDALLERVASHIQTTAAAQTFENNQQDNNNPTTLTTLAGAIANASHRSRVNATASSHARMVSNVADMEKPQNIHEGFVTNPPQNSREDPFVPVLSWWSGGGGGCGDGVGRWRREGHGLETRFGDVTNNSTASGGTTMMMAVAEKDYNEYRDGDDVGRRRIARDMIVPDFHYEHPFREEIESLEYRPWQLEVGNDIANDGGKAAQTDKKDDEEEEDDLGVWISTEEELSNLCHYITQGQLNGDIREVALDLEAHSHRTFAGFVCLIQLSLRRSTKPPTTSTSTTTSSSSSNPTEEEGTPPTPKGHDFLIDALSLRHLIPAHLGPILLNPNILKVMHGADSDIPWLQRDFGCYVVNLFDTGRAARALQFPSAGLAYLLRKYAGFDADKGHQLSDWRRRPLTEDMRRYAVADTRYLLDIYDELRRELLENRSAEEVSIEAVLDRSKRVCLIRYDKEPFRPSGYLGIMDGGRGRRVAAGRNKKGKHEVTSELSSQQEAALKALYDWRDRTARQEDESVQYVCSNAALLRIASNRPVTVSALQRLVNPLPPLVMRRSQEILDAIKMTSGPKSKGGDGGGGGGGGGSKSSTKEVGKIATPNSSTAASRARNREMLSPILGSEDLYQQAGWITPKSITGKGSFASAEGAASESEDEETVRRRLLDVNASNEGFASSQYSSHSIEMATPSLDVEDNDAMQDDDATKRTGSHRGSTTDGLGTARAALGVNDEGNENSITEELMIARKSANLIQKEMIKLLGGATKDGKYGNGFSLMDFIRPIAEPEDFGFEDDEQGNDADDNGNESTPANTAVEAEDEISIPKSMREIYNLSNANRRRSNKEKNQKPVQFKDDEMSDPVEKMKGDDIKEAEAIIASSGGPGGYFGSSKRQRKVAPGKEGDVELMTKMGWVKNKEDAESLAVTSIVNAEHSDAEKDNDVPNHKKGGKSHSNGGGKRETVDYYASMGAIGAFDPNAAPSNNPFFKGAATGAASMVLPESKHSKPYKKNKKR